MNVILTRQQNNYYSNVRSSLVDIYMHSSTSSHPRLFTTTSFQQFILFIFLHEAWGVVASARGNVDAVMHPGLDSSLSCQLLRNRSARAAVDSSSYGYVERSCSLLVLPRCAFCSMVTLPGYSSISAVLRTPVWPHSIMVTDFNYLCFKSMSINHIFEFIW